MIVRSSAAWTGLLGPVVLGGFGLYLLLASPEGEEKAAEGWLCLGLPLTLSLDNLIAGIGLGALGTPILLSAFIIGLISGLLSLLGLCLGSFVVRRYRPGQSSSGAWPSLLWRCCSQSMSAEVVRGLRREGERGS